MNKVSEVKTSVHNTDLERVTDHITINNIFEFFGIEFYTIYRFYKICRKLFLVIFILKIIKMSNLQNLYKVIFSNYHFQNN